MERLDLRLADADRLIEFHAHIGGAGPGRRHNMDVLNRSSLLLSVSAWEWFCEDLIRRNGASLAKRFKRADDLPVGVRDPMLEWYYNKTGMKSLNKTSKEALWSLAGHGWREIYREYVASKTAALNTPNSDNLKKIFRSTLDIDDITLSWRYQRWGPEIYVGKLEDMLKLRHRIAHGDIGDEVVGKGAAVAAVALVRNLGRRSVESVSQNFKRFDLQGRNARLKPA
nr:HEPN domain-containing protein [Novosphingobium hassiacum]